MKGEDVQWYVLHFVPRGIPLTILRKKRRPYCSSGHWESMCLVYRAFRTWEAESIADWRLGVASTQADLCWGNSTCNINAKPVLQPKSIETRALRFGLLDLKTFAAAFAQTCTSCDIALPESYQKPSKNSSTKVLRTLPKASFQFPIGTTGFGRSASLQQLLLLGAFTFKQPKRVRPVFSGTYAGGSIQFTISLGSPASCGQQVNLVSQGLRF